MIVLLAVAGGAAWLFSAHLPSSFLPDEDQGYLYINMQLPNAASLERTSAAAKQVEKILANTPGVQYTTSVVGFSLLSYVRTSYNAFFWVSLKPWDDRKSRDEAISSHQGTFEPATQAAAGRDAFSVSHHPRYPASVLPVALRLF